MTVPLLRAIALGLVLALGCLWWLLPRGIGTLQHKVGEVVRDHHDHVGAFVPAELATTFEVGDGLRTAQAATAEVQLVDGPRLMVRAATLMRFRSGSSGPKRVALAHGELSVLTVEEPVLFETAAGLVRVGPHSRALLREDRERTWVEVFLGRAELEWGSASPSRGLTAGQSASAPHAALSDAPSEPVPPGDAEVRNASDSGTATPPLATERTEQSASTVPGTGQDGDSASARPAQTVPDFTLAPAALLTFYDPAPPTHLRFATERSCPGGASLEVESARGRVISATPVHAFAPGLSSYRLRCGNRPFAAGKVRVVHDAGQRAIAQAAPSNVFDADGRSYTVLYQTRLPELTVRWTSAAPGSKSKLVVSSARGRREFPVSGASLVLPSGTLIDGEHELWFERAGSDLRSRTTRLEIRFDNATPIARLNEPATLPTDGEGSTVSGAVVAGARVSIRGARVAVDPSGRFSQPVTPRADERGVALMIELPHRSVVYFVRRFGAADATK